MASSGVDVLECKGLIACMRVHLEALETWVLIKGEFKFSIISPRRQRSAAPCW